MIRAGGKTGSDRLSGPNPAIEAADPRLLAEPLDYLETEHYRLRATLSLLERITVEPKSDVRIATARFAADFIESDLALHVMDEDGDLFPLLRVRCGGSEDIEKILRVIADEPSREPKLRGDLVRSLEAVARGRTIPRRLQSKIARFAGSQRRVLRWEDAFVLPLARQRLTAEDKNWLSCRMIERRQ